MINQIIDTTTFYNFAGFTASDINANYATQIINDVNALINERLKRIFSLTPNFIKKIRPKNSNVLLLTGNFQDIGVVDSINITSGGSGYVTAPTVTISGGGGSGAMAKANLTGAVVTSIEIINQGSGYTTNPTITLTGNATATATISGLTVYRGDDASANMIQLFTGKDFRFIYYKEPEPGREYPIVAIRLYNDMLDQGEWIQMTGTYGFAPQIPRELLLESDLYDLIKRAVLSSDIDTNTMGQGMLTSSSIDKVRVSFDITKRLTAREAMSEIDQLLKKVQEEYEYTGDYITSIIG